MIMNKIMLAGVSSAALLSLAAPIVANAADTPVAPKTTVEYNQSSNAPVVNQDDASLSVPDGYTFDKTGLDLKGTPGTQQAGSIALYDRDSGAPYSGPQYI